MKHFHCSALLLLVALLVGCAARPVIRPGHSFLAADCPAAGIEAVANHLADEIVAIFPPGHTAIHLHQSGQPEDNFGSTFDQALRSRGFVLLPEPDSSALNVTYTLDRIDPEVWYSKLIFSNGLTLTRTYLASGDSFQISSGARTDKERGDVPR